MDQLTNQAQSLHDAHPDMNAQVAATEQDDQLQPKTAIQRLIAQYKADPSRSQPVTLRAFMARMQTLPRMTMQEPGENAFVMPSDLNQSQLRLVTGLISSRMQRAQFQKEMDKPVSIVREMLLLCYEAKPRLLSFAVSGYTASDFFAYIYQDIALRHMESLTREQKRLPFPDVVEDIKSWMRVPPAPSVQNSPRRHIRRRIMSMLDRSNHQASSLLEDREMPTEVLFLVQKLLERDDDQGYTRGDLRDFREVREDLNWLADYCLRLRYDENSVKVEDLNMVCCPSTVKDFEAITIQRRRGRPRLTDRPAATRKTATKAAAPKTAAKTAKKKAAIKTAAPPQAVTAQAQEDDFGLDALKSLGG